MEVVVVKELDKVSFVIQCAYCRGRGLQPHKTNNWRIKEYLEYSECSMCKGKGALKVQVSDIIIPCARCQGTGLRTGTESDSTIQTCETCRGVGACSLTGELKIIK